MMIEGQHGRDEALRYAYPYIAWDEPITITVPGVGKGLGCRLCIAEDGMHAQDVLLLPQNKAAFKQHQQEVHG